LSNGNIFFEMVSVGFSFSFLTQMKGNFHCKEKYNQHPTDTARGRVTRDGKRNQGTPASRGTRTARPSPRTQTSKTNRCRHRLMEIKSVVGTRKLPPRAPHHPFGEEVVPTPGTTKLNVILTLLPAHPTVVDKAKPHFLQQFTSRPEIVIKHSIVAFHPEKPNHSPTNCHPNLLNFLEAARGAVRVSVGF
jgi:hypothetical protein